ARQSDDVLGVLGDVLSGGQLIVTRDLAALREDLIGRRYPKRKLLDILAAWVDAAGEMPPGGFVEVVDTSEGKARAITDPPAGEWHRPASGTAPFPQAP